jgi:uncharacterized protein
MRNLIITALLCAAWIPAAHSAQLSTYSLNSNIPSRTWLDHRDIKIIKQAQDFSCGAASLATLLNGFYGLSLTEAQILKDMNKPSQMASFEDMAQVVHRYGFKAAGVALNYQQLAKLTMPTLVYLQVQGNDHFSVLRGISPTHVQLADPSMGNRIFSKAQFLAMWETRADEMLKGKILLVLPQDAKTMVSVPDYFLSPTPSSLPVDTLVRQPH